LFELFQQWTPEATTLRRILVDNPARLYDFAD
jgi:predicted TIM-barrel fold metal-dependent hydrolase